MKEELIINQLDFWIEASEKQSEVFKNSGMETSSISSNAMAQAYWNVKQFIQVNQPEDDQFSNVLAIDLVKSWGMEDKLKDNTLYAFRYNECIHESSTATISIHRTRKGAEMAMEFHKENKRKQHLEQIKWEKENTPKGIEIDETFGKHEYWDVDEITIQP